MQLDATLREAMDAIRHLTEPEAPWTSILSTANRLVGSDAAVLIVFEHGRVVDVQQSNADPTAVRDYAEHFHTKDVMTQPHVVKPPGSWLDTQILLPKPQRTRNAYYVDFMCKHRMRQLYSFIIENSPGQWTSLGFQRESAWDGLSDFLASKRIRTYAQAVQQAVERKRVQAASWLASTDAAFDALGEASCLIHASGELVHASPAATAILNARDPLVIQNGRLSVAAPGGSTTLQAGLFRAGIGGQVVRLAFSDSHSGRLLHVEMVRANSAVRIAGEVLVFMRLRHAAQGEVASPEMLSQALAITNAEARVLRALASGTAATEYAQRTGVSIHTVRKQVATLMQKMDCTRQVDLVLAALRIRR